MSNRLEHIKTNCNVSNPFNTPSYQDLQRRIDDRLNHSYSGTNIICALFGELGCVFWRHRHLNKEMPLGE